LIAYAVVADIMAVVPHRPGRRQANHARQGDFMPKLTKYTLEFNEKNAKWALRNDKTRKLAKSFRTKASAIKGGALKRALGKNGGSVKIQKENGRIQEVRTYPGK
jgi:hypothetical protein